MALEKDKSEEFIISKLLERIVNLKKRIDRLVFLFISAFVFGIVNFSEFNEINIFSITIKESSLYHLGLAIVLTMIFALIGSHLIEYCVKREELDKRFLGDEVWGKLKTATDENREAIKKEVSIKQHFQISKTMIPSSIYEYMYSLDLYQKAKEYDLLRDASVVVLFLSFFVGHAVSFYHLFLVPNHWDIELTSKIIVGVVFVLIALIILYLLYREFLKSVSETSKDLGEKLRRRVRIFAAIFSLCCIIGFLAHYN